MLDALYLLATLETPPRWNLDLPGQAQIIEVINKKMKWRTGRVPSQVTDPPDPPVPPPPDPGAVLPKTVNMTTLASTYGTLRYVALAADGGITTGDCSNILTPCTTINRAHSQAVAGDAIVVRGGEYADQIETNITKAGIIITNYDGELPVINGSLDLSGAWTTEGAQEWHAYTEMAVTDARSVNYPGCGNQNGGSSCVGRYPDQVWIADVPLQQVFTKAAATGEKFWVDAPNNRIYVDAAHGGVADTEACEIDQFLTYSAANVKVQGLRVEKYCNDAGDYGVFLVQQSADGASFEDVEVKWCSFECFSLAGATTTPVQDITFLRVSILGGNYGGIFGAHTDRVLFQESECDGLNPWTEFTNSPVSGCIKLTHTWDFKVISSQAINNKSHGFWCDQSCVDMDVGNSISSNNSGDGIFFELSDDILIAGTFLQTSTGNPFQCGGGSSGCKVINSTLVGGTGPLAVYTDTRSEPGCKTSGVVCLGGATSDHDNSANHAPQPAALKWQPGVDLFQNNIVAYPNSASFCGTTTFCITRVHNSVPGGTVTASTPAGTIDTTAASTTVTGAGTTFTSLLIDDAIIVNETGEVLYLASTPGSNTSLTVQTAAKVNADGASTWTRYTNATLSDVTPAGDGITTRAGAHISLPSILHTTAFEPARAQTVMDCNVYAFNSGVSHIVGNPLTTGFLSYATPQLFEDAMDATTGGFPGIDGLDLNSLVGTQYVTNNGLGTPTATLEALHASACAVPNDADIEQYLTEGAQHYGVPWQ